MSKVRRPDKRHDQRTARHRKVHELAKSPCSRPPAVPSNVEVRFHIRETKTELTYHTYLGWREVDTDSFGLTVRTAKYHWQVRACDRQGNPPAAPPGLDLKPPSTFDLGRVGYVLHKGVVSKPRDGDADDWAHVEVGPSIRPRLWFWQGRVKAEDTEGCVGDWSAWSTPVNPYEQRNDAAPKPPVPTGLTMAFTTKESTRFDRYNLRVICNEVGPWDIPGFDRQSDVRSYDFQVQGGVGVDGPWDGQIRTLPHPARDADAAGLVRVVFTGKFWLKRYYRARVRTVDRFNREGDFTPWTPGASPSDVTPPPVPINVELEGIHNAIRVSWDVPPDPLDPELPHPDVAYAQIQVSRGPGFAAADLGRTVRYTVGESRTFQTKLYRQRYWVRVRFVDGAGNKSAWVTLGPLRPQKVQGRVTHLGGHVSEADMDWGDLAGGLGNRAYMTDQSGWNRGVASVEAERIDGVCSTQVETSEVSPARVGAVLRCIDGNNFMGVRLRNDGGTNRLEFFKFDGGTENVSAFSSGFSVALGRVYDLVVSATVGGLWTLEVDGVQFLTYQLSGAEITKYAAAHRIGPYFGQDDFGSRVENISWTDGTPDAVPIVDEEFTRDPNALSLTTADSGQLWRADAGITGIADDELPDAVFGSKVILPVYTAWAAEVNINILSAGAVLVGEGGLNLSPKRIEIFEDTRFIIHAWSSVKNNSATAFNARLFCVVEFDGIKHNGRAASNFCTASDLANNRDRHISVTREIFVPCPADTSKIVKFWWGYRHNAGTGLSSNVGPAGMTIHQHYAPDFVPGVGAQRTRPPWTRSEITAAAYRATGGND